MLLNTITPDELARLIAEEPDRMVPFVGAGMAMGAGAPSADALADEIYRALEIDPSTVSAADRLYSAAAEAVGREKLDSAQAAVANTITGLRMRPSPAMIALTGTTSQLVLTTNYDDGIERAARYRGLEPRALLLGDRSVVEPPGRHELHVVHLHGLPRKPASLVLPGRATSALESDELFTQIARGLLLSKSLVFLGFQLANTETHLQGLIRWANRYDGPTQYLMLPSDQVEARESDLTRITTDGNVVVVPYAADPMHSEVERVALAFAPRVERRSDHKRITFVAPMLLTDPDGSSQDLESVVRALEHGYGYSERDRLVDLVTLTAPGQRSLIVAPPGYGKTLLLEQLAGFDHDRPTAIARLGAFQPNEETPRHGVANCLSPATDESERLEQAVLESSSPALILLDGLDEVAAQHSEAAVDAIADAVCEWPHHSWVVSCRPGARAVALREQGFSSMVIAGSREWARIYLQSRAVPAARIEAALDGDPAIESLIRVPMFAARIADQLLDLPSAERVRPLELILDEVRAASEREGRKKIAGQQAPVRAQMIWEWLRDLAIGLEIAGETSALPAELADFLQDPTLLESLVERALLADAPGSVKFPSKPMQEALFAQAILAASDPLFALKQFAVANVDGQPTLRNDIDFSLDLVFEEASPSVRRELRDIDEIRWARTAIGTLDEEGAREAFETILRWYEHDDWPFWVAPDDGAMLRTPKMAIDDIVRRWPHFVMERREQLIVDLTRGSVAARSRAIGLLGLVEDDELAVWVALGLRDENRNVVSEAARVARERHILALRGELESLLDADDSAVRGIALRTLVALFSISVVRELKPGKPLVWESIEPQIRDELDLDLGISLVARMSPRHFAGWALQRLVSTAHPDAWTAKRVGKLIHALDHVDSAQLDFEVIAAAIAHHPELAIAEVRLRGFGSGPWAPESQLLALHAMVKGELDQLDPELLAAITAARKALTERSHRPAPDWRRHEISDVLEGHGIDVSPYAFEGDIGRRDLDPDHDPLLLQLHNDWWPKEPGGLEGEELSPEARASVNIGRALTAPLSTERWVQLLQAFATQRWRFHAVGDHGVAEWLGDTYDAQDEDKRSALLQAIGSADLGFEKLRLLTWIGGADVLEKVMTRLGDLDPASPGWSSVATQLVGLGGRPISERLLADSDDVQLRRQVTGRLADQGDLEARHDVVDDLTARLLAGETLDANLAPMWQKELPIEPSVAAALLEAALQAEHTRLAAFATQLLVTNPDPRARVGLEEISERVPQARALKSEVARLKRWRATVEVKERIPAGLKERIDRARTVLETSEVLDAELPAQQ